MNYESDGRSVMTLDAGGTNFVFSAVRSNKEIMDSVTLPSNADNLDKCLNTIINGFEQIRTKLDSEPEAISFAFPGPSDYVNGIIGDLGNLPAFRGGVALGPMLEDHFKLPVFINNDGDLFAYGEAISGFLPWVNRLLREAGTQKQFRNLIGVTLGTGFGGGLVRNGELVIGDNGAAGEVWLFRSKANPECFVEEDISIRAIVREYALRSEMEVPEGITPREIYEIAGDNRPGDGEAARAAFRIFGDVLGDALATMITMFDGLVVVGGGLTGAWSLFAPEMLKHINGHLMSVDGNKVSRTEIVAFDLENVRQREAFVTGEEKSIQVPLTSRSVTYDPLKRTGLGLSRLGTSQAVSIGAYAFALNAIDS